MPVLKQGSKGAAVKALQLKLKSLGYDSGSVDGNFGPATKAALIAFQISKGLTADGKAGPITMAALDNARSPQDHDNSYPAAVGSTSPQLLTETDFEAAAKLLKCDVAAIKAVAEVESLGNGFLSDGRVKILFEGHQFYKHTKGAHAQTNPTICHKNWTKKYYTKGSTDVRGAGELARLATAIGLNRTAALKSASYGKFQIMGFNYEVCGFANVEDFYAAMQRNEGEQLKAFSNFVIGNKIDRELRKHDWAGFALKYNGKAYKENKYDTKMAAAYKKYSK